MRIHSNILNGGDFAAAVRAAGLAGVVVREFSIHSSTKRVRGFEVRLAAEPGRDYNGKARRPRMNAPYGSDCSAPIKAATYDEHGQWIKELFKIDPEAIIGPYDGAHDFHEKTRYAYNT